MEEKFSDSHIFSDSQSFLNISIPCLSSRHSHTTNKKFRYWIWEQNSGFLCDFFSQIVWIRVSAQEVCIYVITNLQKSHDHVQEKEDMNQIHSQHNQILSLNTITGISTSTVQLQEQSCYLLINFCSKSGFCWSIPHMTILRGNFISHSLHEKVKTKTSLTTVIQLKSYFQQLDSRIITNSIILIVSTDHIN